MTSLTIDDGKTALRAAFLSASQVSLLLCDRHHRVNEPSGIFLRPPIKRGWSSLKKAGELNMSNHRELNISELEAVSGGAYNRANIPGYHGPTIAKGGEVGGGDTIDGIPWGGHSGDGSWGYVNNALPGAGNWGN
ncbi:MAG TPA: hypothetical protein VID30_01445 [Bradyrhizobium sp.]